MLLSFQFTPINLKIGLQVIHYHNLIQLFHLFQQYFRVLLLFLNQKALELYTSLQLFFIHQILIKLIIHMSSHIITIMYHLVKNSFLFKRVLQVNAYLLVLFHHLSFDLKFVNFLLQPLKISKILISLFYQQLKKPSKVSSYPIIIPLQYIL